MVEVVITFLALLALIALAIALFVLPQTRQLATAGDSLLGRYARELAAAIAVVATLGSLFMSEVAGFIPCLLCWVQRGFMYPLAVALLVTRKLRVPSLWLSIWASGGAVVSAYHYAEEHIPALARSSFCGPEIPCNLIWFERFGFVTLPFMAFCGFAAVAALMLLEHRRARKGALVPPERVES
jgi:disulfide bond formation protein DsbB